MDINKLGPEYFRDIKNQVKGKPDPLKEIVQERLKKEPLEQVKEFRAVKIQGAREVTEKEELEKRSGEMWGCVGRKAHPVAGFMYKSKLRSQFNDLLRGIDLLEKNSRVQSAAEKKKELFPAVEPSTDDIKSLPDLKVMKYGWDVKSLLRQLGFAKEITIDGEVYLYFPDREALLAGWEQLRAIDPTLPPLNILSSEGIATDREFIEAFLLYDVLLSIGKEFVHDSFIHVIPTLGAILSSGKRGFPDYIKQREEIRGMVRNALKRLDLFKEQTPVDHPHSKDLDKMMTALGFFVDLVSSGVYSSGGIALEKSSLDDFFQEVWLGENQPFWEKRFAGETLDFAFLSGFWKQIVETTNPLLDQSSDPVSG